MKYEDYLREVVKDKDFMDHIHANVSLGSFPFTVQCPIDGKRCKDDQCEEYEDGKCLLFELHRVMYKVFGSGDNSMYFDIPLEYEGTRLSWRISFSRSYPKDIGGPDRVSYTIGTDNAAISWKALKEVGLGDYLDGDWENAPTAYFTQKFESLSEIQKFLELVKEKREEFESLLVKYHTCVRCNNVSEYLIRFYDPVGICSGCVVEITEEWLKENEKET